MWNVEHPPSSARVKIVTAINASFQEAYQFDDPAVTQWDFVGKTFRMDVKGNYEQLLPTVSFTSGAGEIVVDNTALRILHFNVPEATIQAAMPPGRYVFDLVMIDGSVRMQLMHGEFVVTDGVTGG